MFIATIGHTPTSALKTTRITQATVLRILSRRILACNREKMSSADPNQPIASTQVIASTRP